MKKVIKFAIVFGLLFIAACYIFVELNRQTYEILDPNVKHILIWTNPTHEPIKYLGKGQNTFEKYQCPVNNCYVTSDRRYMRKYMGDLSDFRVILFHGPEISLEDISLPSTRSFRQQYVFASMESSQYYPLKNEIYNNYFNWTWTYKLNSDLYYGYIIIKNKQGDVIGPQQDMYWLDAEEMEPIDDGLKEELSHKKIAAAWFVSNCRTWSKREDFAEELKKELAKYNMKLDIYGKCGTKNCSRNRNKDCLALVKKLYYFYLSFENSFSEDYVTEKLLTALMNNAVPIVYGGANYTRFMPDGSYLNARELGVETLARRMVEAINDNETYYNFFKWRNHYTYENPGDTQDTNVYCNFCNKIDEKATEVNETEPNASFHKNLNKWWNS